MRCRTTASCQEGSWLVTPSAMDCETPPRPPGCANSPEEAAGACDIPMECVYEDGTRCVCSSCYQGREYPICMPNDPETGEPLTPAWYCEERPRACPSPPPQAGESCAVDPSLNCGQGCEYPISCTDDIWTYGGFGCPICAAPDTPIATPTGEVPIAALRVGDPVYSTDHRGIVVVPILRIGNTPVVQHRAVRVALESGRVLHLSPGHPTADGMTFADLLGGGELDGRPVRSAELVDYPFERTYDILPASSTGTYFAAGSLIGSSMVSPPRFEASDARSHR